MHLIRLFLMMLICSPAMALQNQMQGHPSPYLAMHGKDPVAWQDWDKVAVEQAREQGKLLFISSGYFACHWCHVMQRESYQDAQIAQFINANFVPVKLDRELHGALDAYLIDFVNRTQGHAGWPLNVFLTPEGYPLVGATYLQPERFRELIERLQGTWMEQRGRMRNLARRGLLQRMLEKAPADAEPMSSVQMREAMLMQALELANVMEGGFGDQNKFPMVPQLMALIELQAQVDDPGLGEFLTLTLDQMASEGLRDQLGGGFFRYTVDPSWHIPHFEKMLYSQAQLAEAYLRAAEVFGRDDYAAVAHDTLRFVDREMRGPQGGYISSFSAIDGAGEEGGVYLWTIDQLHALLGEDDTAMARRHWRMFDIAAFPAGHLPRHGETAAQIADALGLPVDGIDQRLADIRSRLLAAREQRVLPADDKELAAWNGLMLAAFSRAAAKDPTFAAAATRIRDFLRNVLWDGTHLHRAVRDGRPIGKVSLEDYALVAYGMARYAAFSDDPADHTFVAVLLNAAWQRYQGAAGWRTDDAPLIPGMADEVALPTGALPSPSAIWIKVALDSGDPVLVEKAVSAAESARRPTQLEPFWHPGHHIALLSLAALPQGSDDAR